MAEPTARRRGQGGVRRGTRRRHRAGDRAEGSIASARMATVLSVDSQSRSVYVMLLAPVLGWAVSGESGDAPGVGSQLL